MERRYPFSSYTLSLGLFACSLLVISRPISYGTLHSPLLLEISFLLVNMGAAHFQTSSDTPLHSYDNLKRTVIIVYHIVNVCLVQNLLYFQRDILQPFCLLSMVLRWEIWLCYLTKLCVWYYVNQTRFYLDQEC